MRRSWCYRRVVVSISILDEREFPDSVEEDLGRDWVGPDVSVLCFIRSATIDEL